MTIAEKIAAHYLEILKLLGEDPERDGLQSTPIRAANALLEATEGMNMTPEDVVGNVLFKTSSQGMVTVANIQFFSTCEHHLMPFEGLVHIGYIPHENVLGLSKIPRMVEMYARRLQIQEQLTEQIADAILTSASALGVFVAISAKHSCMRARGVKSDGEMVTTFASGKFFDNAPLQDQFWNSVRATSLG